MISAEAKLLAKDTWDSDEESSDEESGHNGECEDPLESDGLGEELSDAEGSSEVAESESHGVVLFMLVLTPQYTAPNGSGRTLKITKKNNP